MPSINEQQRHHDEYTDYSCSTSIERLARDIETLLRSWHVNDSDRHFSFEVRSKKSKNNNDEDSFHSSHSHKQNYKVRNGVVFFRNQELSLTLWDHSVFSSIDESGFWKVNSQHLPLSLERSSHFISNGVGHTISSLFGIGQYITLVSSSACSTNSNSSLELQMALNIALDNSNCSIPAFSNILYSNSLVTLKHIPKQIIGYCCNPFVHASFELQKMITIPLWMKQGSWHALVPILAKYSSLEDKIVLHSVRFRHRWDKQDAEWNISEEEWGPSSDPISQLLVTTTWRHNDSNLLTQFAIQPHYDKSISTTPLSASLRTILASFVRTSVLDDDVLLHHLCNVNVLTELQEDDITCLFLSDVTQNLIQVMDWDECCKDLVQNGYLLDHELDSIIREIFTPSETALGERFENGYSSESWLMNNLSIQLMNMRTPSAMAALWLRFLKELRMKWEQKEILLGLQESYDAEKKFVYSYLHGNASTIPDPDLKYSCLLGQKLHVFNIGVMMCIDSVNTTPNLKKRDIKLNTMKQSSFQSLQSLLKTQSSQSYTSTDEIPSSVQSVNSTVDSAIFTPPLSDLVSHATTQVRQGTYCPVHQLSLLKTNDTLYAPFLLRPLPITSDILYQRKLLLRKNSNRNVQTKIALQQFIKPKLASDIMAFKAANPHCAIQDFYNWYGYELSLKHYFDHDMTDTIHQYCYKLWQEKMPKQAMKQQPLFDPDHQVEMLLNFLETMHPSLLLNQIFSMNIIHCVRTLQSFYKTFEDQIPDKLSTVMTLLKQTSQKALHKLKQDVEHIITIMEEHDLHKKKWHISKETLILCEHVCNLIAQTEVIMSRSYSYMMKFNNNLELVNRLMELHENEEDEDEEEDDDTGEVIVEESLDCDLFHNVDPIMKEFCLRNLNDNTPCQLTALVGDGMVLALTRCKRE